MAAATILKTALGTRDVENLCKKAVRGGGGGGGENRVDFLGVGAAHSLPKMDRVIQHKDRTCCFVANTQTKEKDGEHWVAFYFPPKGKGGVPFMFDSYARTPKAMGHADWKEYMKTASKQRGGKGKWRRQHRVVQGMNSSVCGVLCAYYLYHAVRGQMAFPVGENIVPLSKLTSFLNLLK